MPLKYLTGLALKESTTEWGRCLSGRDQWPKNTIEIHCFSWPEVVLEVRSLPFSGTISQGIIPILF